MPTSAKDRLNKLFAHSPLPPKPPSNQQTLTQAKVAEEDSQHKNATEISTATQTPTSNQAPPHRQQPSADDVLASSDEGDDYVAALLRKPKMKASYTCSVDDKSAENSNRDRRLVSRFCPLLLVLKFPYKYMDDVDNRVSERFFANGGIFRRTWNIHYLHLPESFATRPILLVPLDQVQILVDEISSIFDVKVSVPEFPFAIPFYDDSTPQPVFLGISTSRQTKDDLQAAIPEPPVGHGEAPRGASQELCKSFQEWHEKCEAVNIATKKSKASSKKKTRGRYQATDPESAAQIKRIQRYLGLRPPSPDVGIVDGLSWDAQQDRIQQNINQSIVLEFLQSEKPAPYGFEDEPIIVCIDVEAYERDHSIVTEVGVSTLDTMDLAGVAPGASGQNWTKHIRSRHFWIKGRERFVNRDFVHGCPQSFNFGQTERVDLNEVVNLIDGCFLWPFSVQYKHDGQYRPQTMPFDQTLHEQKSKLQDFSSMQKGSKERNIIFVGHDGLTDIAYLSTLGSKIFGPSRDNDTSGQDVDHQRRRYVLTSILEAIDTSTLSKHIQNVTQTKSLASLCKNLGIDAWSLHNAGNDARYTLEVLVKIAIKSRQLQDDAAREIDSTSKTCTESPSEIARSQPMDTKLAQARQDLRDEFKVMEEAKQRGQTYPALAGATFHKYVPVLLKQRIKQKHNNVSTQDFRDQDGSGQPWDVAQSAKAEENWGADVIFQHTDDFCW